MLKIKLIRYYKILKNFLDKFIMTEEVFKEHIILKEYNSKYSNFIGI